MAEVKQINNSNNSSDIDVNIRVKLCEPSLGVL